MSMRRELLCTRGRGELSLGRGLTERTGLLVRLLIGLLVGLLEMVSLRRQRHVNLLSRRREMGLLLLHVELQRWGLREVV